MVNPTSLFSSQQSGYLISAPWRSSGKTMVSVGLAAVARARLNHVQTFKKGPDYIDPLWLAAASGQPCYNLDPYQQDTDELLHTYSAHAKSASVNLVEGTMGLHDGLASDGSDSNAAIASLLRLPVILVVDCRGMHRTVAALISGIQHFDPEIKFAGVILNRIRSDRHAQKIRKALTAYTDMPLLGVIPDVENVSIQEQELGLTPTLEHAAASDCIKSIEKLIEDNTDVDSLFKTDVTPRCRRKSEITIAAPNCSGRSTVIGIARDEAFQFYYQDDLDYFKALGVKLVECSPCRGSFPTNLDGLWIGGGFPERHAAALSGNATFLTALRSAVKAGLPVHAECGGLMYLCRSLQLEDASWPMTDVIHADVSMQSKAVGRGYMQLTHVDDNAETLSAHEFHHSTVTFDTQPDFAYRVHRGYGIDGVRDGVIQDNVIASYAHFRHTRKTPWIDWFLSRVEEHRSGPAYHYV